jgi:NTP pyrophosphatase (non-canonical NTP hydrolase)
MSTYFANMEAQVQALVDGKGWNDKPVPLPQAVAMLHSEVTEILEAWREWGTKDMTAKPRRWRWQWWRPVVPKPEGMGSECADVLIRLLDTAHRFEIDLEAEFNKKMAYNWTRPYRWSKI